MPIIFDSFVISKQQKSHKNQRIHDKEKTECVANHGIMILMAMKFKALPSDMLGV